MRNIEWTKNSKITNFWSQILVFQIKKISEIFLFSNLDSSKNFQFESLAKSFAQNPAKRVAKRLA